MSSETGTQLRGHWLLLARMLWLAIFVLTLVVFCGNLVVGNYGLVTTITLVLETSVWFAVGLVLFWRKSSDRAILLFSLHSSSRRSSSFPDFRALYIPTEPGGFPPISWRPGQLFSHRLVYVSRWSLCSRPHALASPGWVAVGFVPIPIFGVAHPWNWWLSPLYALVRIAFYGSIALVVLYRYRRRSTPVQRQQIKWLVFALTIFTVEAMVVEFVVFLVPAYFPALGLLNQLYQYAKLLTPILSILIPLSIGIALLRYRLWDIDLIINRTLVYGTLDRSRWLWSTLASIGLGHLCACSQGALSSLLWSLLSRPLLLWLSSSPCAIAFRVLLIVASTGASMMRPRSLEAFSATLRNEVDLNQLREHLISGGAGDDAASACLALVA